MERVTLKVKVPVAVREYVDRIATAADVGRDAVVAVMLATVMADPETERYIAEYKQELDDDRPESAENDATEQNVADQ